MTHSSNGFAVRVEALETYVRAGGPLATEVDKLATSTRHAATALPAGAFGQLAEQTGFAKAVSGFRTAAGARIDVTGKTMHSVATSVDHIRTQYEETEKAVTKRLHNAHHPHPQHNTGTSGSGTLIVG
jgi:hypothetical protein